MSPIAKKTSRQFDYQAKSTELEMLLERLQSPDIQIDEASRLYEVGMELAKEIETYLKQSENTVRKHTSGEQ